MGDRDPAVLKVASELYSRAMAHAQAVNILANSDQFDKRMFPPIQLLLGLATELILKSAYLMHGGNSKLLMRTRGKGIGHDLREALEAAERQGFRPSDRDLHWLVDVLAEAHMGHWMRYGDMPEIITTPAPEKALRVLRDLFLQLRRDFPALLTDA